MPLRKVGELSDYTEEHSNITLHSFRRKNLESHNEIRICKSKTRTNSLSALSPDFRFVKHMRTESIYDSLRLHHRSKN
jgi:hypothetical protein